MEEQKPSRAWWDLKIEAATTEELIEAAKDPGTYFIDLTFILEALGGRHDSLEDSAKDQVQAVLLDGLTNKHALVREGAIYGLTDFVVRPIVYAAIGRLAQHDQSATIREIALSVLQDFMSGSGGPIGVEK